MNEQQFAYWLQGFAELNEQPPTEAQWKSIREHLETVFRKVTPAHMSHKIPEMKDSPTIREILDRATRDGQNHGPMVPYQPYFKGAGDFPPGTIIC